jgi:hypothetical protein
LRVFSSTSFPPEPPIFGWTIGVPLTAAFLGAFFWANTPSFALNQEARVSLRVRRE